jgi:hypothetical protein
MEDSLDAVTARGVDAFDHIQVGKRWNGASASRVAVDRRVGAIGHHRDDRKPWCAMGVA